MVGQQGYPTDPAGDGVAYYVLVEIDSDGSIAVALKKTGDSVVLHDRDEIKILMMLKFSPSLCFVLTANKPTSRHHDIPCRKLSCKPIEGFLNHCRQPPLQIVRLASYE